MKATAGLLVAVCAPLVSSCGGQSAPVGSDDASADVAAAGDAADAGSLVDAPGDSTLDALPPREGGDVEAGPADCTYGDSGSQFDAGSRFQGTCAGGCPARTICAVEIGGVNGGGGEYCAPIPDRCISTPTCACLASCACGQSFGRPETCFDQTSQDGGKALSCDNGIL